MAEKKVDLHIWLDVSLADRLKDMAAENGLSFTAQARMLLLQALRNQD